MPTNYQQLVQEAKCHIKEISVETLHQHLSRDNVLVIDTREPTEITTGVIANALCIPRGILEGSLSTIPCVKDLADPLAELAEYQLYLYCRTGARSALAAESLQSMGFTNVYSVAGGIVAWQEQGFPLVKKGD